MCRGGAVRGHGDGLWVLWLMSVCRARSLSLFGIEALPVEVEVDVSSGLPGFSIVGLHLGGRTADTSKSQRPAGLSLR